MLESSTDLLVLKSVPVCQNRSRRAACTDIATPHRNVRQSALEHDDGILEPSVQTSPQDCAIRRAALLDGSAAELVEVTRREKVQFQFQGPVHLLVFCEQGVRRDGESFVEGLPCSSCKNVTRKFTFVPAGRRYVDWQESRTLTRMIYIYFDPARMPADPERSEVLPRLFFEDAILCQTALKLSKLIGSPEPDDRQYLQALMPVLLQELVRATSGKGTRQARGGLAGWQQRKVMEYMEEHFAEQLPLNVLADLVGLSCFHFCRAFKQSFGAPPHQYQVGRRIEHAKNLLHKSTTSVTTIGFSVGFSDASSFTAAFRRAMGITPTAYRRSIEDRCDEHALCASGAK